MAFVGAIGESVPDVLPEWAFFVRAVLDTERLGLTASREALHDDELLDETRARLGDQLKRWLLRMARTDRQRAEDFFRVHHLAVKAAATNAAHSTSTLPSAAASQAVSAGASASASAFVSTSRSRLSHLSRSG